MIKKEGMTIGELEKKSGVKRSTIHHYVQYGLLPRPSKTGQTMAYYDHSHLQRLDAIQKIKLDFLKTAKTSRIPLDLIKGELSETFTLTKDKGKEQTASEKANQERGGKKRKEIIDATLKLYGDRGYYLTSIRDIAKEVGISAPTVYHYFPDKRELFMEVIEYVVRNLRREYQTAMAHEKDIGRRAQIMFEVFYKHFSKISEIINQLRAGVAIGDPWAKERLGKLYRDMTANMARQVSLGIKNGLVRDVDPQLLGFFIILIDEIAMLRASLDNQYTVSQLMFFIGDMMYHAFLTEKGKKVFGAGETGRV
jgi:AcrR family transcriptional regulator